MEKDKYKIPLIIVITVVITFILTVGMKADSQEEKLAKIKKQYDDREQTLIEIIKIQNEQFRKGGE